MSNFELKQLEQSIRAMGELGFANAAQVLKQHPSLEQNKTLDVSLLNSVDSAGLSVLLHWQRAAANSDIVLQLTGLSSQLRSLIDIAGLQQLLPSVELSNLPDNEFC